MPKKEITSLTALRGLAAWWVVVFHFKAYLPQSFLAIASPIVERGYLAVDLFFVLSGFVIYWNHSQLTPFDRQGMLEFGLKRFARIYPLHLLMLAAYAGLLFVIVALHHGYPAQRFSSTSFIFDLFLLQDWSPNTALTWNDPAWSISAEAAAYLVFPLIAPVVSQLRRRWAMVLTGGLILGALTFVFAFHRFELGADIGSVGILRCIGEFALGALSARAFANASPTPTPHKVLLLLAASLMAYFSIFVGTAPTFPVVWVIGIYLLAGYSPSVEYWPVRAAVLLGKISFATYMCHYFVYDVFKLVAVRPSVQPPLAFVVLAFLAILIASILLHFLIEQRAYHFLVSELRKRAVGDSIAA